MSDRRPDRELVAAFTGGDHAALGAIYDRYAAALHDTASAMLRDPHDAADATHDVFVAASAHLHRLRDPDRLRAWLFAVLRNEVYRRSDRRRRQRPVDVTELRDMAAPTDPRAEGAALEGAELGALVRAAAAGLDERDQLLLELSVRQGLAGAELAAAVGVTAEQCHVLVHRMRDRAQRAIGALVVARAGRRDCAELDAVLSGWDGRYTPVVRKRVGRHVERCAACGEASRKLAVVPLVSAAPAFALPMGLRERTLHDARSATTTTVGTAAFEAATGFPAAVGRRTSRALVALVLAVVLALVGAGAVAVAVGGGRDAGTAAVEATTARPASTGTSAPRSITSTIAPSPVGTTTAPATTSSTVAPTTSLVATTADAADVTEPTTVAPAVPPVVPPAPIDTTAPPAPGQVAASVTVVDLGVDRASAQLTLTNVGGAPAAWSITGAAAPFTLSTTSGTLVPGGRTDVVVFLARDAVAEGDLVRVLTLTDVGALTVRAGIERAPVVTLVRAPTTLVCPWSVRPLVAVTVADESTVTGATLAWTGPGAAGSVAMRAGGGGWSGNLGIPGRNGTWTWTVTATDARGNRGAASGAVAVSGC